MFFNDLMNKVRYWDNKMAKWMIRHFYILFFEVFLVVIFVGLFVITIKVLDASTDVKNSVVEKLLLCQSFNTLLITVLLLLNSFWMLYIFNGVQRMITLLRDMTYHLTRMRNPPRNP